MNTTSKIESGIEVATKDSLDIASHIENATKPVAEDKDPAKTIDYASDPAFALAFTDNQYITQIGSIVTAGTENGVDWKCVQAPKTDSGASDKPPAISDLQYLVNELQESLTRTALTNKPPSIELKSIVNDTVKVGHVPLLALPIVDSIRLQMRCWMHRKKAIHCLRLEVIPCVDGNGGSKISLDVYLLSRRRGIRFREQVVLPEPLFRSQQPA